MSDNVITSKVGREKYALALGTSTHLPKVVKMAFGDGGVDANGVPMFPDREAKPLLLGNKLLEKPIETVDYPISTSVRFTCTLTKQDLNDKNISEIALIDEDGDIVVKKTFTSKGKDADSEMIFYLEPEF